MNKTLVALVVLTALSGCASITQGTNQVISFNIEPRDGVCSVANKDGGTIGTVTGRSNLLQVSKGAGDLVANCSADGYKNYTTRLVSSTQTAGVLGIAIDFGIVDMLTGAMWKYPENVSIVLEKDELQKQKK